jgi:hypothetical protein
MVTVEEMSLASVLETITHGRVLGTSAPRAGSRLTHTNEPLTTKASLLYLRGQILDLRDAHPAVLNDIPQPTEPSTLSACAELSTPPDNCSANRSKLSHPKAFRFFNKIVLEYDRCSHMLPDHTYIMQIDGRRTIYPYFDSGSERVSDFTRPSLFLDTKKVGGKVRA